MATRNAPRAWVAVFRARAFGLLVLLALGLLLSGCATTGQDMGTTGAAGEPKDTPVPKVEPLSRQGNAVSYVVKGKRYHTLRDASGHVEKGMASWYGKRFHGRRTSNGERYDMHAMTAAHKNLPLPSVVKVTNLDNGRSTVVRVNDRGPFHGNRVIDLSYAAATKLDMVQRGSAKVEIQVLDPSGKPRLEEGLQNIFVAASDKARSEAKEVAVATRLAGNRDTLEEAALVAASAKGESSKVAALYLQVGAFGSRANAEQLRRQLVAELEAGVQVRTDGASESHPYKVQVGPFKTRDQVDRFSSKLASLGLDKPRVVAR
jgi:rare lipoprotein A